MSRIIEAQAVISAQDKTGATFEAIAKKFKGIDKTVAEMASRRIDFGWGRAFQREIDKLNPSIRQMERMRSDFEKLHVLLARTPLSAARHLDFVDQWKNRTIANIRAVAAESERFERIHTRIASTARMMAGAAAGYLGYRGARTAVEKIGEAERENSRETLAGMTPNEQSYVATRARYLSAKPGFQSIGQTEIREHMRAARSVFGDLHHADQVIEPMLQAQVMLSGKRTPETASHDVDYLVKAMELAGKFEPAQFNRILGGFVKAAGLYGDTIKGSDFYHMAQYARGSLPFLSEDFLARVAPAMMQEVGGQQFGTMLGSMHSALIGGRMKKESAALLGEYGLYDQEAKTVTQRDALMSNPYKWAQDVLRPALAARGVTDPKDIGESVAKMFSNRMVGDLFEKMLLQAERFEKLNKLYEKQPGLDAYQIVPQKDPFVALAGVREQIFNFMQTVGGPYGEKAAAVLNQIAGSIGNVAKSLGDDPSKAAGVGAGLGVAGGVLGLGGAWLLGKGAMRMMGGLVGGGQLKSVTDVMQAEINAYGRTGAVASAAGGGMLSTMVGRVLPVIGGAMWAGSILDDIASHPNRRSFRDIARDNDDFTLNGTGTFRQWAGSYKPEFRDLLKADNALGGISESLANIKAEVSGNIAIDSKVTVEASPDFITKVANKVKADLGPINVRNSEGLPASGTAGSTGRSMPETMGHH